jgi:Ca2+-binding RTX toxin-like protein
MRALATVVLLGSAVACPGVVPAEAAAPATCLGRPVTIDLNSADAPNPHRSASDVVLGTRRGERIRTGAGDDVVCAGGGRDRIAAGKGDDIIHGGSARDLISGSLGDDLISGGSGDDTMAGHDGADLLFGRSGYDLMYGGPGADVMHGGAEGDVMNGGLAPAGERDEIYGDAGTDLLQSSPTDDLLVGGEGTDEVTYEFIDTGSSAGVLFDLALAGQQDTISAGLDEISGVENARGSPQDDSIFGTNENNTLLGMGGEDFMDARGGFDICYASDDGVGDTFVSCEL